MMGLPAGRLIEPRQQARTHPLRLRLGDGGDQNALPPASSGVSGKLAPPPLPLQASRERWPTLRSRSSATGQPLNVGTFVAVYLAIGFLVGLALFGWLAVSAIRRHGVRNAVRGAARTYAEELPLYWRVPVAASTFVIALPLIAAWAIATGDWDPVGVIFLTLLWLLYVGLLRWHWAAKGRSRECNRLGQVK